MKSLDKCFEKFKEGITEYSSKPFFIKGNKMVYRSFQTFEPKEKDIEQVTEQVMNGYAILLDYVKKSYTREEVINHLTRYGDKRIRRYEEEVVAIKKGKYIVWNENAYNFNKINTFDIPNDILRVPFTGNEEFFCRDIKEIIADKTLSRYDMDVLADNGVVEIINHPLINKDFLDPLMVLAKRGCYRVLEDKSVFIYNKKQNYYWDKDHTPEYDSPLHQLISSCDIKIEELKDVVGVSYEFLTTQYDKRERVTVKILDEMINRPNVFKFIFDNKEVCHDELS